MLFGSSSDGADHLVWLPCREAVKPPLLVPVFRDRLLGELCDGQAVRFDPGEDCLDNVRGAEKGAKRGDFGALEEEDHQINR